MLDGNPDNHKSLTQLQDCLQTLEAIASDRRLMASLDEDHRKRLVMAAGRVAKPDRFAVTKLAKALRRQKRHNISIADRMSLSDTEIRQARLTDIFIAPNPKAFIEEQQQIRRLNKPKNCYVCKTEYTELHFFYDSMCLGCAQINYTKRFQSADLSGKIALITGARVKIGYQAALKLLRAGAQVIVTTRFPHDASVRYSQEQDFRDWQDRLQIFGLDLRHAPSVEVFAQYINDNYEYLDFLLNNAAQTVRRPRGFYAHLLPAEQIQPKDPQILKLLAHYNRCLTQLNLQNKQADSKALLSYTNSDSSLEKHLPGLHTSATLSQIPLLPDDLRFGAETFPVNAYDADLQQLDLRETNSWRMQLADVPTAEMLEIQLINAVAPFILCSKLKPLMLKRNSHDKHIVNVSAMEGKFSRYTKTDKHPHTNMAKAALNMLTQTSAPDYVKDGIHMNAVDTGWVTDEDPLMHATRKREELNFQPPLDIVDGAARICDPIFSGFNNSEHIWGKFLKDYAPTSW